MTFNQIRVTCRRQSDYIITLFITNEIALFLTWLLVNTRITPNHVTLASLFFGLGGAVFYSFGHFLAGSILLFISHVLDCTDGNLARAKNMFSPIGKWLDMVGDRIAESFLMVGAAIYFYRTGVANHWTYLSLTDAILLMLYYYSVDISLALKLLRPIQRLSSYKFKNVRVKWGLLEPVLYGFIVLAPLGLLKFQVILVFLLSIAGIAYQIQKTSVCSKNT